jgi:hypothetical protein
MATQPKEAPRRAMSRNDILLDRLRGIGSAVGDLDLRIAEAVKAVRDERTRFAGGDAGRIQWNWYVGQLIADIGFERYRLAGAARKKPKPGEVPPGPILELLVGLAPRLLALQESQGASQDTADSP